MVLHVRKRRHLSCVGNRENYGCLQQIVEEFPGMEYWLKEAVKHKQCKQSFKLSFDIVNE